MFDMKTSSTICQRKLNLLTYWLLERLTKNTFFQHFGDFQPKYTFYEIFAWRAQKSHAFLFIHVSDNSTVEHAHAYSCLYIHAYFRLHWANHFNTGYHWKDVFLLQNLSINDANFGQRWWCQKEQRPMLVIAGYSQHRNQISYKFNGSVKIGCDVKSTIKG